MHIYTGVTSVGKDESNVGFAYVDLRDGDISYIQRAGAEEYSARSSAEGALQQYHYTAIFPSMVNVNDVPTYFMGLVDSANLIKSYAFVSYENYQNVGVGTTVEEAYTNYVKIIGGNATKPNENVTSEISFTISDIRTVVIDGNTVILMMDDGNRIYRYNMSKGDLRTSFLKQGDSVKVLCDEYNEIAEFIEIIIGNTQSEVEETEETTE